MLVGVKSPSPSGSVVTVIAIAPRCPIRSQLVAGLALRPGALASAGERQASHGQVHDK